MRRIYSTRDMYKQLWGKIWRRERDYQDRGVHIYIYMQTFNRSQTFIVQRPQTTHTCSHNRLHSPHHTDVKAARASHTPRTGHTYSKTPSQSHKLPSSLLGLNDNLPHARPKLSRKTATIANISTLVIIAISKENTLVYHYSYYLCRSRFFSVLVPNIYILLMCYIGGKVSAVQHFF